MGKFRFENLAYPTLQELQEKISRNQYGSLDLSGNGNREVEAIPDGLVVPGTLNLEKCKKLRGIPNGLTVKRLDASETNIVCLPRDLIAESVNVSFCSQLELIPDGINIKRKLDITRCEKLSQLPVGLQHCEIQMRGCNRIKELPPDYRKSVGFHADWGWSGLEYIPDGFIVDSFLLCLDGCKNLRTLPRDITFGKPIEDRSNGTIFLPSLNLSYSGIESLPPGLYVPGNLSLVGCENLRELPCNLVVGGSLQLSSYLRMKLPDDLSVGGQIIYS